MKKTHFIAIMGLLITSASAQANTRFVVSSPANSLTTYSPAMISQSTRQPDACFATSTGTEWCLPVLNATGDQLISHNSVQNFVQSGKLPELHSATIHVPDGMSDSEAQTILEQSGLYAFVERDLEITSQAGEWASITTPNDTYFDRQHLFRTNAPFSRAGSSVLAAWSKIKNPEKNVDIYVIDSGFELHNDLSYANGFSFVVNQFDNERKAGFIETEFTPSCQSTHGLNVASIIGAKINNAEGIAGVAGDITIHPLRALNCGRGFLSDAAAALDWLSKNDDYLRTQSPDLPKFTGNAGIVNMSFGSLSNSACPAYIQNAINRAINAGFTVVASAGNDASPASNNVPSSCDGVVSVGAVYQSNDNKTETADLSSFSNYGDALDVVALGTDVALLNATSGMASGNGTSYAAPIVSGIFALIAKDFDFTADQYKLLASISTESGADVFTKGGQCDALGCGNGLLNADKMYANAQRLVDGTLNQATFKMSAASACGQKLAIDIFNEGQSLCEQVIVTMDMYSNIKANQTIKLFAVTQGTVLSDTPDTTTMTPIINAGTTNITLNIADFSGNDVYGQLCDSDTDVCSKLAKVDTKPLLTKPEACQ